MVINFAALGFIFQVMRGCTIDSYRDNKAAILSHPRGVMGLDDAIGVCYLDNASKSRSKRGLARKESASSSLWGSDPSDHKFAILCHQVNARYCEY